MYQPTVRNSMAWDNTVRSDWNFDTIRSSSAMGSFRSMARDLVMPAGMVLDEADESEDEEGRGSIDSGAATKGSDPIINSLGMSSHASHSTVVIKPLPLHSPEPSLIPTIPSEVSELLEELPSVAPPAYGSLHGSVPRRSSYAERSSLEGSGKVIREADLGSGIDTIRPVKKVDPVGSLKLSAEFVGNLRRESSGSAPPSPIAHRRAASEVGRAGRTMVDDIVLPILQNVSFIYQTVQS